MPRPPVRFGDMIWADQADGGIVTIGGISKRYDSRQEACVAFFKTLKQKLLHDIEIEAPRIIINFEDMWWADQIDDGIVMIGGISKRYDSRQEACVTFCETLKQKLLREIENDIARARILSAKSQAAYI